MAETNSLHLKYIKNILIPEIVEKYVDESLDTFVAEHSGGIDGFMSALYNIRLKTKTATGTKDRLLIAKFMKGDKAFRESSKSYIQFANEIFIYATVLPAYERTRKEANITDMSIEHLVPQSIIAKYGYIDGLSAAPGESESVLVLENVKPQGYTLGPRLYLRRDQLLGMSRLLGQYHAFSYALRIRNPSEFERLKNGIVPLPFVYDNDEYAEKNNLFRVLYRIGFDRLFDFFDRKIDTNTFDGQSEEELKLISQLRRLREKYFEAPNRLLERLRTGVEGSEKDPLFGVILHGDYNRNNVFFKYKSSSGGEPGNLSEVENVKMFDFQELRYGSPAIDLSFFMCINTPEGERAVLWPEILREYHANMFKILSTIVKANVSDANELQELDNKLNNYSFEKFNAHFARYAFYGVMICIHFLPWLLCSEVECTRLSQLFETDMHGEEFRKLSIEAGGDSTNLRLLDIIRHACKLGYMNNI